MEGNFKGRKKNALNLKTPSAWIIVAATVFVLIFSIVFATNRANEGIGDHDFYNFNVNGFTLGADIDKMDTSALTPTEPLNINNGYDYNFEEVRYSADENTGRLKKMFVNVYDGAYIPVVTIHTGEAASYIPNNLTTIEQITTIFGQGKKGWQDREQGLRYMEYRQKEGRLSATE
ncbi:hypothetical protein [Lachnoclostridium phytofermentans]|uniref:Uncharacterized protein n=1 Tax=Lachnoclostridium phytofermentans (strain ATCC 700394 / DSM 18823 / ISDg) TaxID=357809 RepID=A9KR83_LACP7|nr:hypothetical protein [Lachnoclostridium phytofermentans]ABX40551.1 conserved hypothetical protein [Lachnoclostridium phytofermentans ISDg]